MNNHIHRREERKKKQITSTPWNRIKCNEYKERRERGHKKKKKSTLKIHLKPPTGVLLGGVTDTLRSSVLMRSMTGQTTWVGSRAMRSSRGSIQPAGSTLQNTGIGDRESGIGNRGLLALVGLGWTVQMCDGRCANFVLRVCDRVLWLEVSY